MTLSISLVLALARVLTPGDSGVDWHSPGIPKQGSTAAVMRM
jgi:hypothetical protein